MNAKPPLHPVRTIAELATACLGLAVFVAPVVIHPPAQLNKAPLFPILATAVEHLQIASVIGLAVAGLVSGLAARAPFYLLGLATVWLLPVAMVAELIADGTSHNLFPFELIMYLMLAIPGVLGAGLGRLIRKRLIRTKLA